MRVAALLVVLAAAALRLVGLPASGLGHWDAGTYTAGVLGLGPYAQGGQLPHYAPPLLPLLHRFLFAVGGPSALLPSLLAALVGTATVAVLMAFGRRLLGPVPALAAGAALASMEYHVTYSREPLTDALFTLLVLLVLWGGWEGLVSGRVRPWWLAGLAGAAACVTKYHGALALILLAALLLLLPLLQGAPRSWSASPAAGMPAPPTAARAPRGRAWAGWLRAALVVGLAMAAVLVWLEATVGLRAWLQARREWMAEPGLYLLPMSASFVGRALGAWVSPLVLLAAGAGLVVALRRRTPAHGLLLVWLVGWLVALVAYRHYPRLLLPALPALALAAGLGAERLLSLLFGGARRGVLALGCALPLLAAGAWETLPTLAPTGTGYRELAALLAQAEPGEGPDLLVVQHAALMALREAPHPFVCYDEPEAARLLESGRFRHLVFDLRSIHAGLFAEWLDEHRGELDLVAIVPNPLPEPFVVNLVGFEVLAASRRDTRLREELRTVRVWRRQGDP